MTTPRIAVLLVALASAPLTAQDPEKPAAPPDPVAAIEAWVGSDLGDRTALERATAAVLDAGDAGFRALAAAARSTKPDQRERRMGVETLISDVVVGAIRRGTESGMRFAGQYDGLRELQPYAGRMLLALVADTPDWFPDDMRQLVVPALRDVFPKGPDRAAMDKLREIAEDVDFEAQPLREALAYALAQWGMRDLVQKHIEELERNAGEGRDTDELHFVRELANVHYELREYAEAAALWTKFVTGMRAADADVAALDLYNAACSMSRAGRVDDALKALDECAALVADGRVDSTAEITRKMFESDPDLRTARADDRFAAIVKRAFGDEKGEGKKVPEKGR